MAPAKGKKKATRGSEAPCTLTRSAEMEAKLDRFGELKVKFAGVRFVDFGLIFPHSETRLEWQATLRDQRGILLLEPVLRLILGL